MSTEKHTAGPWHVFSVYAQHEVRTPTDTLVAVVNSRDDARLIAAAPELLACLRAVEVLFAPHCKDSTQADWLDRAQVLLRRLGAA